MDHFKERSTRYYRQTPLFTKEELAEREEEEKEVYDDLSEEDIDEEYSEYDEYYDDDNA